MLRMQHKAIHLQSRLCFFMRIVLLSSQIFSCLKLNFSTVIPLYSFCYSATTSTSTTLSSSAFSVADAA
jgi:hypothetical protein